MTFRECKSNENEGKRLNVKNFALKLWNYAWCSPCDATYGWKDPNYLVKSLVRLTKLKHLGFVLMDHGWMDVELWTYRWFVTL